MKHYFLYKYQIIFLIIVTLLGPSVYAEEESLVKERVDAWVETFNENDPEGMADFYEDTEDLDMLVSAGLWHRGIREVKKAYENDKKYWEYYDSNAKKRHIRVLENMALVSFEHRFKLRSLEKDLNLQIHIRTTMTMRKIDSEWKIVSEHSSPINGIDRVREITNDRE